MVRPRKIVDRREVTYSEEDWQRFRSFREDSKQILRVLHEFDIEGFVHGSVARGDVKESSDIDVITFQSIPSYKIELALEEGGFKKFDRKIVMATPWQLPKAHISLGGDKTVSFPLEKPKKLEEEFYQFGGMVGLSKIEREKRVPGVDKRLVLIDPIPDGHAESQTVGREGEIAHRLGVSIDIVRERIQVLTRRDETGKTGIFLERKLSPDESFESVWKEILDSNSRIIRKC